MRVVIDLRWMQPGVAGGIENLSRAFLSELMGLDRTNAYTVLVPAEARHDFDVRHRDNFRFETPDGPGALGNGLLRRARRLLGRADRQGAPAPDAVLSLSGYIRPDMFRHRNVLVFADLQHEFHPEFFSPEALEERRRVFSTSIRKADRLIAISEHTRRTVVERFQFPEERTSTAHLAADACFHPERWDPERLPAVLAKYGLARGEYLLFPANTWAHKNHVGALEALACLRERHGLAPRLVLTGAAKEGHAAMLAAAERLGLAPGLRFLGYCPVEEMPALYRGAAALFYPTLFEGFGIPLVEAMWCRCPIVCSDATSLPEIAGDAALLADPRSPQALADALARVLTDEALRAELVERGSRRVRQFSWRQFTLEVLRVLAEAPVAPGAKLH